MNPGIIETDLLEHSKAKVQLYSKYLSVYLNILSHARRYSTISIFDLLCGEGLYSNNEKGSPLACLDVVRKHCETIGDSCPRINILFNDSGKSEIVPGKTKIQRLMEIVNSYELPQNIHIDFQELDFDMILPEACKKAEYTSQSKSLFFVDPYGYKRVKPSQIEEILSLKNVELILFLPATFMYRFANSCLENKFCGGGPLESFLVELFKSNEVRFESIDDFILKCKNQFKENLSKYQILVDSFSIQRNRTNTYVLYFFTRNYLGFEKMLETKWQMDEERGRGFRMDRQMSLFSGVDCSDYPGQLESLISGNEMTTNAQLYAFGLENGYLPKHTNKVLGRIKSRNRNFELISLDGKLAKGYYISYSNFGPNPEREIAVRIKRP